MRNGTRPGWLIAVVGMAFWAACDGGGPPSRGFGSRQIYASSDPSLHLGYWTDAGLRFYLGDAPQAEFVVDPETGQVSPAPMPKTTAPTPAPPGERFECVRESPSLGDGITTTTITDRESGVKTVIEGLASCPRTPEEVLVVVRRGADGTTLWVGPYTGLERVAPGLRVQEVVFAIRESSIAVLAAPEAEPEAMALYSISLETFEVTELIPARLTSAEVAGGGTFVGDLSSSRLSTTRLPFGYSSPVQPHVDHYFYTRVMSDGREVYFVGPFETGARELAIAAVPDSSDFRSVVFPAFGLPPPENWIEPGGLRFWDDEALRLLSCPWETAGRVAGAVLAADHRVLVGGDPEGAYKRSALTLVSFSGAATEMVCASLAASGVVSADVSPGGKHIFWIGVTPDRKWGLWVADSDGTHAALVWAASSTMRDAYFLDETHLELEVDGDLVWLDLSRPEEGVHLVAANNHGRPRSLSASKVITIYDFNPQDGTGTFGLCDRYTQAKRFISKAVSEYIQPVQLSPDDPDAQAVAYVVRGRNPSPQDGIWVATFSPEDLR